MSIFILFVVEERSCFLYVVDNVRIVFVLSNCGVIVIFAILRPGAFSAKKKWANAGDLGI